jgi:hypothetical protein
MDGRRVRLGDKSSPRRKTLVFALQADDQDPKVQVHLEVELVGITRTYEVEKLVLTCEQLHFGLPRLNSIEVTAGRRESKVAYTPRRRTGWIEIDPDLLEQIKHYI